MSIRLAAMIALTALPGLVQAKLPPPSEEAQASAAATKAKADWSAKVAAYQLCVSQNRVAEHYLKTSGGRKSGADVPSCVDPGPFNPPAPTAQDTSAQSDAAPKKTQ